MQRRDEEEKVEEKEGEDDGMTPARCGRWLGQGQALEAMGRATMLPTVLLDMLLVVLLVLLVLVLMVVVLME